MFRRVVALALSCLGGAPVASAAETVRIAHQRHFPPFIEVKDGKSTGLVIDIVRAAALKAGLDVVFVAVPFEQVQGTLTDGSADAIVPLAITSERLASFDFSAPILMTGGALYVKAPNPTPASLAALAGKTVVTPGTGPLMPYLQKNAPDIKLVITTDYQESLARIVKGEADAAALNYQVGASMAAQLYPGQVTMPSKMFEEIPDAIAVSKGKHAELLKALDAGIAGIRADGTWQKINDRWMGR